MDVKTDTTTTETMAPHEADHYAAIQDQARDVERLAGEMAAAKEDAAEAKKAYDGAATELRKLILRGPNPQAELPFGDDQDDWRGWPIGNHLDLPDGITTALDKAEIETLGDLSEAMDRDGWHRDIPGIGPAAAEKIGHAFTAFWESHPEAAAAG